MAAHDGRQRRSDASAEVRVVRDAEAHEHGAQVRVAETKWTIIVAVLGDLLGGVAGEIDDDVHREDEHADGLAVTFDVEVALVVEELHQVDAGEVTRRVIEEHVLAAGVRAVDAVRVRAGVPVVDGRVVLNAGVGAVPSGKRNLAPEVAGLEGLHGLAGGSHGGVPLTVALHSLHELVGDAHAVVRVLAAHRVVGLAVEVGVVALGDERLGLLLFAGLPRDEVHDLWVVHVEADHLGRASRGAAALRRASRAVEDFEEAHQTAGGAAAAQLLLATADAGEVRAGAGAELEEAGFVLHELVDLHEVIVDALDETSRALGA